MARPLEFDIDEALEAAMQQFWKEGYEASSIQKLLNVMGINRGSLYATFGDKETLFELTLKRYESLMDDHMQRTLLAIEDPVQAIEAFIGHNRRSDKFWVYGCYYTNAASELAYINPQLSKQIAKKQRVVEKSLLSRLKDAKAQGVLEDHADPETLASFLMAVRSGLCVRARLGDKKPKLSNILSTAMRLVA